MECLLEREKDAQFIERLDHENKVKLKQLGGSSGGMKRSHSNSNYSNILKTIGNSNTTTNGGGDGILG